MSEHPSDELLKSWADNALRGAELLRVDDHVAACAQCRAAAAPAPAHAARAWRATLAGAHLGGAELEAYVDGALSEDARVEVDAHTSFCRMCADELADLHAFRARERRPAVIGWLAAAALIVVVVAGIGAYLRSARPRTEPAPRIVAQAPPRPVQEPRALLRDGNTTFPLARGGGVEGLPPRAAETLRQLRAGVVAGAAVFADVQGGRDVLRGSQTSKTEPRILEPFGIVTDDRPRFAWVDAAAPAGATHVVEIFDRSLASVARSGELTAQTWRPERPLERGRTYQWQLERRVGDQRIVAPAPPAPPGRFRIASAEGMEEILAARARGSHLLAALAFAREGMIDDARRELDLLASLNPGSPLIAELRATLDRAVRSRT